MFRPLRTFTGAHSMQTPKELKPFILANGTWRENTFSVLTTALFESRPFMRFPEGIQAARNYGRILDLILEYIDDTGRSDLIGNLKTLVTIDINSFWGFFDDHMKVAAIISPAIADRDIIKLLGAINTALEKLEQRSA